MLWGTEVAWGWRFSLVQGAPAGYLENLSSLMLWPCYAPGTWDIKNATEAGLLCLVSGLRVSYCSEKWNLILKLGITLTSWSLPVPGRYYLRMCIPVSWPSAAAPEIENPCVTGWGLLGTSGEIVCVEENLEESWACQCLLIIDTGHLC